MNGTDIKNFYKILNKGDTSGRVPDSVDRAEGEGTLAGRITRGRTPREKGLNTSFRFKKFLYSNHFPKVLLLFAAVTSLFFYQFLLQGKIPIPADTIVGIYHPFRDYVWNGYTTGVPFKNFLITDPVRQQYPWRNLSISQLKEGLLPLWNPYSFSGTPLLANFQSAVFYPLNIIFFILPFPVAWGLLVFLSPLLAGYFLYLYLRYMNLSPLSSFIGAVSFAFCGVTIAWLEWNTIVHVFLWLPIILLSIEHLLKKVSPGWLSILLFAQSASILAGHLQILFYIFVFANFYLFFRILTLAQKAKSPHGFLNIFIHKYTPFILIGLIALIITSVQWIPTVYFIIHSARQFDLASFDSPGWFLPYQNLIQFFAPDFFGNPATFNYYGIWNYGEFIGFIGIIPLIFAFFALVFRQDKKVFFFGTFFFLSLIMATSNPVSQIPFLLNIPLLNSSQPTRLLVLCVFSLSVLAALGFDRFQKKSTDKKTLTQMITILIAFTFIYTLLWLTVLSRNIIFQDQSFINNLAISQRNLIFPSFIFIFSGLLILSFFKAAPKIKIFILYIIIFVLLADLFRFGAKFTPFSNPDWLYPQTRILTLMQNNIGNYRFLSLDRRIMAPDFSIMYKLQDVAGYDPLYLESYGEFVAAWERGEPDISPASFNRIITPMDINSPFADLLGVKYVLSLEDRSDKKLKLINRQGQTRLYENLNVIPRTFIISDVVVAHNDADEMKSLYRIKNDLASKATSQQTISLDHDPIQASERSEIIDYSAEYIKIKATVLKNRLLVLTDIYYPTWRAYIDGKETPVYKIDYTFRGIIIPAGNHNIEYKNSII